jgi:hypothetical protein
MIVDLRNHKYLPRPQLMKLINAYKTGEPIELINVEPEVQAQLELTRLNLIFGGIKSPSDRILALADLTEKQDRICLGCVAAMIYLITLVVTAWPTI